jgi:uncharacterized repeat protein (TIGR04138 family)
MQTVNFEEALERILADNRRYRREAYVFVREGLDFTQRTVSKNKKEEGKHVSGQQLVQGIRDYALDQYGPMALAVLQEWGINRCEDIGEIVFIMVNCGLLKKTDQDTMEDFRGGYDFHETFRAPFLPKSKIVAPAEEVKPVQG